MIGLPLIPTTQLDSFARSAFVSAENLADASIGDRLARMLENGGRVLATDGLLEGLASSAIANHPNLLRVDLNGQPESMLSMRADALQRVRAHALGPFGVTFDAPQRVALTLLGDDLAAVSNFANQPAKVRLRVDGKSGEAILAIPMNQRAIASGQDALSNVLPARSLTVYRFK